jgi:5'-phosphate synthase pdxT subunit
MAYGSQIHSAFKEIKLKNDQQLLACFIRAPGITKIVGENVEILATTPCGNPCAVRQSNIFGLAFHPEINGILDFHRMAFS